MTATIPIAEQVDEVARACRSLERYPGRMTPEVAAAKLARLRAAHATLRLVEAHADGLRILIAHLRAVHYGEPPTADDTAALIAHPAVREVLATFPEAEIAEIRPSAPAEYAKHADGGHTPDPDHHQEPDAA